jgi:hypothetical protein
MNHEGHKEHEGTTKKDRLRVQWLPFCPDRFLSGHPALRGYLSDLFLYKSESMKLISCLRVSAVKYLLQLAACCTS